MNPLSHLLPELESGLVALGLPAQPLAGRLLDYLALLDRLWGFITNIVYGDGS